MLNRRLIRIKVFKALYSSVNSGSDSLELAQKALERSCESTLDLYHFLLNITGYLTVLARERIDAALHKFHPTDEEANPNMRFVDNRFSEIVGSDPEHGRICFKKGLVWDEYDVLVKKIYASITASEYYREYMDAPDTTLKADCDLFKRIFEEEFEDNESLAAILEDRCVDWADDLSYVLNVIIRDIDAIARDGKLPVERVFLKDEDTIFAKELLAESFTGYAGYLESVFANSDNWDSDRLVSTDTALIVMGIAEAVRFPSIPVKVTINEYVEISKFYSTPNSRVFVNGILDKVIKDKIASGEISKKDNNN